MFKPDPTSTKFLATYEETQESMDIRSVRMLRSLHEKAPGRVKVRWNTRTGMVHSVRGLLTSPQVGSAREIADRFLSEHRELFGIPENTDDFQYVDTKERRGMKHVSYQQRFQGLPVVGAELVVHIDQGNRVQMVNGSCFPGIETDMHAAMISEENAVEAVFAAIQTEEPPSAQQVELVIFPREAQYVRAYKIMAHTQKPLGDWVYFVDASTGMVLDGYNAIHFARGNGYLYHTNPERDNKVSSAELFDLDASQTLSGVYFTIKNAGESAENAAPTGPGSYDFLYSDPMDSHFDEVMAYYHLSKVAELFRNLGYTEHSSSMPGYVHVPNPYNGSPNYDNAYFSPSENAVYFGHGDTMNDLAQEAAVIYHEYTHSVVHAVQPFMGTHEAGALHEGYADYFACSLTSDPKIGEFAVAQLGQEYLRDLRSQKTYDDFTETDVHIDGEIWGSTCWKIQETLGRHTVDLLIYESLWYLPENATFIDAYEAIIQADTMLFNGEHLEELEQVFEDKKIVETPVETHVIVASARTGGTIVPSGTVSVTHGADQTFQIIPNSGYGIQHVLVDGVSAGSVTAYTFSQVTAAHTIEAIFEAEDQLEQTVIVPGNTQWLDTGMEIAVGDILSFTAQGTVVYDTKGNSCNPEGTSWTDSRDKQDPLWQKPHAGLIGKIEGIGAPFFIGSSYMVKAASSGHLLLGINDYWYQGNSGEFIVTIQIENKA